MTETADKIMERLTNNIPERYDVRPNTYTYDVEKSVAIEFENAYDVIDSKDKQFYACTATGKYLEDRVGEFGLKRKKATASIGYVTIKGDVGAVVSAGSKVAAGNIIFNITDNAVIGNGGSVTVPVICDIMSAVGNVDAHAVNRFPITLPGLISVFNAEPISGGSDTETDSELNARFLEHVSHPITSGNKWQYISWAKSVEGVGGAKCQPLWNGNGTVKVIIVGAGKQLAGKELISKVQNYIDEQHPVGASVTVTTAEAKTIDIKCKLIADADAKERAKENIKEYLRDVSFQRGYVSQAKIGQAILNTENVVDYSNLTVNGDIDNIPISETEIAVLGGVEFD